MVTFNTTFFQSLFAFRYRSWTETHTSWCGSYWFFWCVKRTRSMEVISRNYYSKTEETFTYLTPAKKSSPSKWYILVYCEASLSGFIWKFRIRPLLLQTENSIYNYHSHQVFFILLARRPLVRVSSSGISLEFRREIIRLTNDKIKDPFNFRSIIQLILFWVWQELLITKNNS